MPVGCFAGCDPPGAGWDELDGLVVGRGAGALEVLEVLDVGGGGELFVVDGVVTDGVVTEGVLTEGVVTAGVPTDGVVTDGVLTVGSDDEDAAGGIAIAVIAPSSPAPTDATNSLLPLHTS